MRTTLLTLLLYITGLTQANAQATEFALNQQLNISYQKIMATQDGNLLIDGADNNNHGVLLKVNATTMQPMWQIKINLPLFTVLQIQESKDSTYLLLGSTSDTDNNYYGYVTRLTSTGNVIFSKLYTSTDGDIVANVISNSAGSDGGFLLMGGNCAYQTFAMKCNYMGDIEWQYQYSLNLNGLGVAIRRPTTIIPQNKSYTFFDQAYIDHSNGFVAGVLDSLGNTSGWIFNGMDDTLMQYPVVGKFIRLNNGSYFNYLGNFPSLYQSYISFTDSNFHQSTIYRINYPLHIAIEDIIQLADSNILMSGYTEDTVSSSPRFGTYHTLTPSGNLISNTFSSFFAPLFPYEYPFGFVNGITQLPNGKVASSIGTLDRVGLTLTNSDMTGLCHDTVITDITLVPFVTPFTSSPYIITRSGTNIYTSDTNSIVNYPTYFDDSCGGKLANAIDEAAPQAYGFSFYPNPATTSVTITTGEEMMSSTITVTDITGRKIAAVQLTTHPSTLSTSNYNSGVYLVTVTSNDGRSATKKLVISK